MPFVEATMIAGYGPDVKARLVTAFTRGVLSVMAANPDGVIVVLREVEPSNWARGGVSRVPGPPLPYAIDVVRDFAKSPGAVAAAEYSSFEEAYTDNGSLVFAEGTVDGQAIIDRFHVVAGKIIAHTRWAGTAAT